jgi:transposase
LRIPTISRSTLYPQVRLASPPIFGGRVRGVRGPLWLDAVRQDDLPSLHTLAAGIDRDRDAVIAGLTLPWNSGVVEGHVNRIKMLKRQMFGRAGFALLRKRVLLAN